MKTENQLITDMLFCFLKGEAGVNALIETAQERCAQIDWEYIFEKLKREGVASTFFYYAKKSGTQNLIPDSIFSSLLNHSTSILTQNMAAIGEARKVLSKFQDNAIPVIMLKGLFLIEHIYPHPAMRGLSDIDIMVRRNDIFRVNDCLRTLGYQAMDGKPETAVHNPPGYLASLDYFHEQGLPHRIHMHWHIVNTSVPAYMFAPGIDMNRIWNKAITVRIADTDVRILYPEHALLYLCEHALRVGHAFDRLILLCDIILLCRAYRDRINWVTLWDEGRILHMERFLFLSLSVVEIFTGIPVPDYIKNQFNQNNGLRLGERLFLSIHKRKKRFRGSSYLIYLSMNRNVTSFLYFIFRTFFPPTDVLLQRCYAHEKTNMREKGLLYRERISEIFRHAWSLKDVFFKE